MVSEAQFPLLNNPKCKIVSYEKISPSTKLLRALAQYGSGLIQLHFTKQKHSDSKYEYLGEKAKLQPALNSVAHRVPTPV